MVKIISVQQFRKDRKEVLKDIQKGLVFVYPTDTIYGIGCDATNQKAVARVRQAKQRDRKPFSVIVPSKQWIQKNCMVTKKAVVWLRRLPGHYTLILKLKNKKCVAANVTLRSGKLGIRIPKNLSASLARDTKKPIVSTSANLTGQPFMTNLDNLNVLVKEKVDLIIYEGQKKARPSTIVDLTGEKPVIMKR